MADPAVEPDGEDDAIIELTGTQKSAILTMLLGEDEAAEILKNLSPREVQHLGGAMAMWPNTWAPYDKRGAYLSQ